MKKFLLLLATSIVLLTGCSNVGSNTIGSTTVGAGAGALLGQAIGKDSKATLLGAGIGALGGALVGSVQDQTQATTDEKLSAASEDWYPVIVWWSPLTGELGRPGECGNNRCFFTINKSYHSHPSTHAFLFYGE